jgi:histidine triad (HIT) family protein
MATDCIFCRIVNGDVPSEIVYQDDLVVAFPDIRPAAPVHLLIMPRKHIASAADLDQSDALLAGHLMAVASRLAREAGVSETGYRLVVNSGPDGGQVVPHLHVHLLGGRQMRALG